MRTNGARPIETVILKELIPHIDATYRTIPKREARMIEGFSMGRTAPVILGSNIQSCFGSISMLIDVVAVDLKVMKTRHADIFQRVFDGNQDIFNAAHPLALAVEERRAQPKDGRRFDRRWERSSGRTRLCTRRWSAWGSSMITTC